MISALESLRPMGRGPRATRAAESDLRLKRRREDPSSFQLETKDKEKDQSEKRLVSTFSSSVLTLFIAYVVGG